MNAPLRAHWFAGLELLSTAVIVVDRSLQLMYANPAAEDLFAFSLRNPQHARLDHLLAGNPGLQALIEQARDAESSFLDNDLPLAINGTVTHAACQVSPVQREPRQGETWLVLEFRALDQQLRIAREEKLLELQRMNRELMRNLAHEIKNPLGGIRGSAQLLERELPGAELREYTQVIVKEADRLQTLLDRLLTPHRLPRLGPVNVHEVLERVRSLILAEFPSGLAVLRDYDISLPELTGDIEQLIQAVLNIVRNAAQALEGYGEIRLQTRIARNVTLARERHRQAIRIDILDNGPGVAPDLAERIFFPLVTGRAEGSGLGLSLAQNFVHQHRGVIEFTSSPGATCFSILLPVFTAARH